MQNRKHSIQGFVYAKCRVEGRQGYIKFNYFGLSQLWVIISVSEVFSSGQENYTMTGFNLKFYCCLLVSFLCPVSGSAKISINEIGGVDWFSLDVPQESLNPIHGIVFSESDLLAHIGELEHDNDTPQIKVARKLIRSLFHRLPSGYVPSCIPTKIAFFLGPRQIGNLVGEYMGKPDSLNGGNASFYTHYRNKLLVEDSGVKEKLRFQHRLYCITDQEERKKQGFINAFSSAKLIADKLCSGTELQKVEYAYEDLSKGL